VLPCGYSIIVPASGPPDSKGAYDVPPETVCTTTHNRAVIISKVAKECADAKAYIDAFYKSIPPSPPAPPKMTNEEKMEWFCDQPENRGPSCSVRARTMLPYISDYAKYPGLDKRGEVIPPPIPAYHFDPNNW